MTGTTYEFDAVTVSTPGDRVATLAEGWNVGGVPKGGYLLAVATRALLAETTRGRGWDVGTRRRWRKCARTSPRSPGSSGRSRISASTSRLWRRSSRRRSPRPTSAFSCGRSPEIPCRLARSRKRWSCASARRTSASPSGNRTAAPRWRGGRPSQTGAPLDTPSLPLFADAFPPTVFNAGFPLGWMPTIELPVHVRARPHPGPLLCAFRSNLVSGGYMEVDGLLFDSTGAPVAMSRQLASVPRGPR